MRIGAIGDLHGRDYWKEFVLNNKIDKWIFLGDYTDSFYESNDKILSNLLDIIQFKKDFPDKVVLLLGNHDLAYMYIDDQRMRCSGFRPEIMFHLNDIFTNNKDLFVNAYQIGDVIFTHAGIQHNWFINRFKGDEFQVDYTIAEQLNNPLDRKQDDALYQVGALRGGLRHDVGGPFWCDMHELRKPLEGFTQVVGHNPVKNIHRYEYKNSYVWYCDCLRDKVEYLDLVI